ncbi:MAG: hypothetical protein IT464_06975 [Planctomycetes bacterium]|nr:hypothetical protein [Planctomycetota bacterium]
MAFSGLVVVLFALTGALSSAECGRNHSESSDCRAARLAVQVQTACISDDADDPEAKYEEEKALWLGLAERDMTGLKAETDKWKLDQTFLSNLESYFASYSELEAAILEREANRIALRKAEQGKGDSNWDGRLKPKPRELIALVLNDDDFNTWTDKHKLSGESWLRQLVRLRGLLAAGAFRTMFDVSALKERADALLQGPIPGIPRETILRWVAEINLRIRIAPDIIALLKTQEPEWNEYEAGMAKQYGNDLRSFLADPKAKPFKKADVDKRIAEEEAKGQPGEETKERPGSDKDSGGSKKQPEKDR